MTSARCDIKFCQKFGDQPAFLDVDKVDLQHSIALTAQRRMAVMICDSKPDRFTYSTVHQTMLAAGRMQCLCLQFVPCLLSCSVLHETSV